jgi:hypothetical protein
MLFPGRDKENGARSHQPFLLIHLLLSTPSQIQKYLSMSVGMRRHPIERLKMSVDPK